MINGESKIRSQGAKPDCIFVVISVLTSSLGRSLSLPSLVKFAKLQQEALCPGAVVSQGFRLRFSCMFPGQASNKKKETARAAGQCRVVNRSNRYTFLLSTDSAVGETEIFRSRNFENSYLKRLPRQCSVIKFHPFGFIFSRLLGKEICITCSTAANVPHGLRYTSPFPFLFRRKAGMEK